MSKLDDAFLKAYAKVRGTAPARPAKPVDVEPSEELEGEIWIDKGAEVFVRPDEGVVNVASFIARTSSGRTRGTSSRGDNGVPLPPSSPDSSSWDHSGTLPTGDDAVVLDIGHSLRGPHFQPIALDLAALDQFAPLVATAPMIEARGSVRNQATPAHAPQAQPPRGFHQSAPGARPTKAAAQTTAPVTQFELDEEEITIVNPVYDRPVPVFRRDTPHYVPAVEEATFDSEEVDETSEHIFAFPREEVSAIIADEDAAAVQHVASPIEVPQTEPSLEEQPAGTTQPLLAFTAAWEVDRFEFAPIVWDLSSETSPLWQAAEQMQLAVQEGLRVLAIASPLRGQGRTTLAITLSRMLAATGLNVVLVDGDIDRPSIAEDLSLEIRLGWGDAVRTGISVEEVAVQSVEDGFTVLPMAPPESSKGVRPSAEATTQMMQRLRDAFDVVIIDTANVNVVGGWIPGSDTPCQIDAALVIQDLRQDDPESMQACLRRLQKQGIENIGLVENFADNQ